MAPARAVGDILVLVLPKLTPTGHEQQGRRPVVVVGVPEKPRYPMFVVAPLTSNVGRWAEDNYLYPVLEPGQGGLPVRSVVLIEHLRGFDATRKFTQIGRLSPNEYKPVQVGLERLFGAEHK